MSACFKVTAAEELARRVGCSYREACGRLGARGGKRAQERARVKRIRAEVRERAYWWQN